MKLLKRLVKSLQDQRVKDDPQIDRKKMNGDERDHSPKRNQLNQRKKFQNDLKTSLKERNPKNETLHLAKISKRRKIQLRIQFQKETSKTISKIKFRNQRKIDSQFSTISMNDR